VVCWEEPHGTLSLQIWPESGGAPVCVSVLEGSVCRVLGSRVLQFGVVGCKRVWGVGLGCMVWSEGVRVVGLGFIVWSV